jgi:hypothetical protein
MWAEGEDRRHRAVTALVTEWERAGALAPGLDTREAADLMWALGGSDVFRLLVNEKGWDPERFLERASSILEQVLFGRSGGV